MKEFIYMTLIVLFMGIGLFMGLRINYDNEHIEHIDLPEEISQIEPGDTLCYTKHHDTLYIEFYHRNAHSQDGMKQYIFKP